MEQNAPRAEHIEAAEADADYQKLWGTSAGLHTRRDEQRLSGIKLSQRLLQYL